MRLLSAPGEDEIPAILFKSCSNSICLPLFIMWNFSFESGEIDQKYLSQLIAPIFLRYNNHQTTDHCPWPLMCSKFSRELSRRKWFNTLRKIICFRVTNMAFARGAVAYLSYLHILIFSMKTLEIHLTLIQFILISERHLIKLIMPCWSRSCSCMALKVNC